MIAVLPDESIQGLRFAYASIGHLFFPCLDAVALVGRPESFRDSLGDTPPFVPIFEDD